MKKCLFVVLATVLTSISLYAQETHFGLKAGMNLASVDVENNEDYDSKVGLHLGGLAHIHLTRHFALQPEVVFSMQGGEDDAGKLKLNYINVPLLAQYMFDEGFRIQTGPQLGFLVSAKKKIGDVDVDYDDAYSNIDFSWTIGAGYLFPVGLGLDARYNFGINDIDESGFESRNRVFQVGLFYQFMHNKPVRK
jgi:hypothetical protein